MDSKPPTSQLRDGEQNLEALSQTFNTIVHECKVIFYREIIQLSQFDTDTVPHLIFCQTFLFVTEIFNKMSKSALQDNTNKTGTARGILNIIQSKSYNSVLSISTYLLSAQLFNQPTHARKSKI